MNESNKFGKQSRLWNVPTGQRICWYDHNRDTTYPMLFIIIRSTGMPTNLIDAKKAFTKKYDLNARDRTKNEKNSKWKHEKYSGILPVHIDKKDSTSDNLIIGCIPEMFRCIS